MNKIILIGGGPTVGKSFLAKRLSDDLNFPWISTDLIRDVMRKLVREEDYPDLFKFYGEAIKPEEYLFTNSPQKIVDDQNLENIQTWPGVKAFFDVDYDWGDYIVEGIAVLPSLVSGLKYENIDFMPIFLVDDNRERMRKVIFERGLWDDADKYSDDIKEVEVKWVMLFSEFIKEEAKKYNYKVYTRDEVQNGYDGLLLEVQAFMKS